MKLNHVINVNLTLLVSSRSKTKRLNYLPWSQRPWWPSESVCSTICRFLGELNLQVFHRSSLSNFSQNNRPIHLIFSNIKVLDIDIIIREYHQIWPDIYRGIESQSCRSSYKLLPAWLIVTTAGQPGDLLASRWLFSAHPSNSSQNVL